MSESQDLEHHISRGGIMKNTFWIYLVAFLIAPMQYIIRILVAKNLPIEQVGLLYSLLGLTGILAIYNDLGFKEAISYFYPQYLANKQYDKSKTLLFITLVFQVITSCILGWLLYACSSFIALHYLKDASGQFIVQIFGLYLIFYILFNFIDGLFMIFQDAYRNKIIALINHSVLTLLVIFVPFGLFTIIGVKSLLTGYALANIIPSLIGIGVGLWAFLKKYSGTIFRGKLVWDKAEYKVIQWYALGVLFTNNILFLISQIDLQIMTFLFGTKYGALYSYGMMLTNLIITLLAPIATLLYPLISHLKARDLQDTMHDLLYALINYIGVIALIGSLFLFANSNAIMTMLFGSAYFEAGSLIKRNLLFVVFGTLNVIIFSIYAGLGLVKKRMKMLVVALVLNLVANAVLSYFMGPNGIAFAMGLTWLTLFVYGYGDLRKHGVPMQIDYWLMGKNLLVGSVVLYLISLAMSDVPIDRLEILQQISIAGIFYVGALGLVNWKTVQKARVVGQKLIKVNKD